MTDQLLPIGTWVVYDPSGGCRPDRAIVGVVHDHVLGAMIMQTRYPDHRNDLAVNVRRAKPENILHVLHEAREPEFQAGDLVKRKIGAHQTFEVTGRVRWIGDLDTGCFSHRLILAADGSEAGWTSECFLERETRKSRFVSLASA